jgi:SAM-dependent methyltransferase
VTPDTEQDAEAFWEAHHANSDATDPAPNQVLVDHAASLAAGTALDLGCGNGGDALWLADHGWSVTAVDIAASALALLRRNALSRGVHALVNTERHDLSSSFPGGSFDLVCASYLHTPFELDRPRVFRRALDSLRVAGTLLVVDHGSAAPWSWDRDDAHFPPLDAILELIRPDPTHFRATHVEARPRTAVGPDGARAVVTDHIVAIQRTTA